MSIRSPLIPLAVGPQRCLVASFPPPPTSTISEAIVKFYKRDPDRALAGMAELTLKQRGAYNSILDLLYSRDGDLPDDDARIARMISCHWREWKSVKRDLIAAGKIWSEGGKIHARRVQETIKNAASFAQEQRKKASRTPQDPENTNENNRPPEPRVRATRAPLTATATAIEERGPREEKLSQVRAVREADGWPDDETEFDDGEALH